MTDHSRDPRIVDAVAQYLHNNSAFAGILTFDELPPAGRDAWREDAAIILEIARCAQEEIDAST